jgi:DNA helicase II / ATP-dependent DNA helicase PcrA
MLLTKQQVDIIEAGYTECALVHAGPGTGKTEVVARRLNHLLGNQGLTPGKILVLSFSRAAVKALIQRINSLRETDNGIIEDLRYLSVRTFDSWSFRMLRLMGEEPSSLLRNSYEENIALLIKRLRTSTREKLLVNESLRLSKIRHVIVDECQDLTGLRAKLVQVLLEKLVPAAECKGGFLECGFTILGDPNQAIYGWTLDECRGDDNLTSQELMSWIRETYRPSLKIRPLDINHRATGACQ